MTSLCVRDAEGGVPRGRNTNRRLLEYVKDVTIHSHRTDRVKVGDRKLSQSHSYKLYAYGSTRGKVPYRSLLPVEQHLLLRGQWHLSAPRASHTHQDLAGAHRSISHLSM